MTYGCGAGVAASLGSCFSGAITSDRIQLLRFSEQKHSFNLKKPCSTPNSVLPLKLQTFSDTLLERVGEEAAGAAAPSILEVLRGAVSNASREPVGSLKGV